ncbi:DUF86 domain-containing protein [Candidatus Bathyarchaeota archaeon]|nr:DUF86 domain-containing protein [Candidatus Bathyarchaeota archaeon]
MVDRDFVNGKARDVRNAINELTRLASKRFEDMSLDEQYSMRYQLIVLTESVVSLCSHIALEAYGYEPSSYKDCVAYICQREGVSCVEDLKALVGLRNLLVHRYRNIDDRLIHNSMKSNFKCVHELLGRIVSKYG